MTEQKIPKTIMMIDDDQFLLDMYALKFKKEDIDIHTFTSAEDALAKLAEGFEPEIIMYDIIMPKMDGPTFALEMEKRGLGKKSIKIVVSNQGEKKDIEAMNDREVDAYIVKALYTPSEVYQKVLEIYNT